MRYNNETCEINIKYALAYIFRQWRKMLCIGFILGFLLSLYQVVNYYKNFDTNKKNYDEKIQTYLYDLDDYNFKKKQYEFKIDKYKQDIKDKEEYLEKSILMNIDYRNKAQANATIFFKLDETVWDEYGGTAYDPTDSLISLFFNKLSYNTDWNDIAKKYSAESKYISELVSLEKQMDSNIIKVSVSHSIPETAEGILDELINVISQQSKSFDDNIFKHTISIMKNDTKIVNDVSLYNLQKSNQEELLSVSKTITDTKDAIETLVEPVFNVEKPSYALLIKNVIIFLLIGFLLGIIIVFAVYTLIYCTGNKIHSKEEFDDMDGIKVLGKISSKNTKRFGKKIDCLFETIVNTNTNMTLEQEEKLLIFNIKDVTKAAKNILIIGNAPEEALNVIKDLITNSVNNSNVTIERDIIKNADAYHKIIENDVVIAVEKIGNSKYSDIYNTENLIKERNKEISGYILV